MKNNVKILKNPFKNNFFNAEKLLKRVMVFSFVLKKING